MANLAPTFNELLKEHNAGRIGGKAFSIDHINDFLREAYQINYRIGELLAYLRTIRQPYLSTAPPPRRRQVEQRGSKEVVYFTDTQRDQIDAEAKGVLRDLHAAVGNLSQAEEIRQQADKAIAQKKKRRNGFGVLGSWAAGGGVVSKSLEEQAEEARVNGVRAFREGVMWFLHTRLEHCGSVQSSMMEIRIKREVEKSKSVLYKARAAGPVPVWDETIDTNKPVGGRSTPGPGSKALGVPLQESEANGQPAQLDEEQVQLLAKENQDLIKHYENKLDQVRTAEKSLVEISELQSTLASNLEIQSAHIDQLVQDSFLTTENVDSGNAQLKRATERKSTARMLFYATTGACAFFILWDFFI